MAAAVLLAACIKEEIVSGGDSGSRFVLMGFTTDMVQTHTQLVDDGLALHWTAGDKTMNEMETVIVFNGKGIKENFRIPESQELSQKFSVC